MNLTLRRIDFRDDGILGQILDETSNLVVYSLEHAYDTGNGDGSYAPKVPAGTYTCVRGQHQLAHMYYPFTTFEITKVPNHIRILFHVGNWNEDSDGCVLLGSNVTTYNKAMVTQSRVAFDKFMALQNGLDQFQLTVL